MQESEYQLNVIITICLLIGFCFLVSAMRGCEKERMEHKERMEACAEAK